MRHAFTQAFIIYGYVCSFISLSTYTLIYAGGSSFEERVADCCTTHSGYKPEE